jgi:hypothetical protein
MAKDKKLSTMEISKLIEKNKQLREEKYLAESKKRLQRILEKKLKTAFIGAIAAFEEYFGKLWGHDKNDDDLTEREIQFQKLWELARTKILNNGNNQLRALETELDHHTVKWNRYTFTTIFYDKGEKDE